MLILSRKTDQQIKIGDDITLTIIEIRGDQVKIGVEAPKDVLAGKPLGADTRESLVSYEFNE